jgi:hypothetical protein
MYVPTLNAFYKWFIDCLFPSFVSVRSPFQGKS